MAAYNRSERKPDARRSRKPRGRGAGRGMRRKQNRFYVVFSREQKVVDYKDTEKLSRFLTEKGKIIPRRITGLTAAQQRILAGAIKRARHAGLLAFQAN